MMMLPWKVSTLFVCVKNVKKSWSCTPAESEKSINNSAVLIRSSCDDNTQKNELNEDKLIFKF